MVDVVAVLADDVEQRAGHLGLGQLLARDRRHPLTLADELDDGRVAVEVDDADDIVDVVAVEAGGGREVDEVLTVRLEPVRGEELRRR